MRLLLSAGLRLLTAPFAAAVSLFETAAQRFEVVGEAARAVERLFRAVALGAPGRGLSLLQALRHLAESTRGRAACLARRLRPALLGAARALAYALGHAVAPERVGGLVQTPRRRLPALAERARRLAHILFEIVDRIGERLLALGQTLARRPRRCVALLLLPLLLLTLLPASARASLRSARRSRAAREDASPCCPCC